MTFAGDDAILQMLRRYIRRVRTQSLAMRCADALVMLFGGLSIVSVLDAWLALPPVAREVAFDGFVLAAALRVLPAAARLIDRRPNLVRAAEHLERRVPQLQQQLSTLLSQRDSTSALAPELHASVQAVLRDDPMLLRRCSTWRPTARRFCIAVIVMAATGLLDVRIGIQPKRLLPPWPGATSDVP